MAVEMPPRSRDHPGALPAAGGLVLLVAAVSGALEAVGVSAVGEGHAAGGFGWLTLTCLAALASVVPEVAVGPAVIGGVAGSVGLHVVARMLPDSPFRPTAGAAAMVMIAVFLVPYVRRLAAARPTVPQSGLLAAAVLAIGGTALEILGDLDTVQGSGLADLADLATALAPTVLAVAVLVATALAEWFLSPDDGSTGSDPWGRAQVLLLVAGWLMVVAGAVTGNLAALFSSASLHGLAVVVFLARVGSRLGPIRWPSFGREAWAGLAVIALAAHLGLLAHVVFGVTGGRYLETSRVPSWLEFGADHVALAGAAGAALLGLALDRAGVASAALRGTMWWGLAVGVAGSVGGRAAGVDALVVAGGVVLGAALSAGAAIALAAALAARPRRRP